MLKMTIPVSVVSVKAAKDVKSSNYADFLFVGGSISIPVDQAAFDTLKPLEGSEVLASFQMKPSGIARFGRSVSIFEAVKFLGLVK
ncbi:hypothetical protein [uncultured Victivallis sp.]|jgi:hypothetical protein|uniref:hypothetical protein n=1 Tax=uncultured Victivallis sp. TaxID=354118 RepID=UPI00259365BF|nr:hypothetical protein [uncultured Victivallis sp.]